MILGTAGHIDHGKTALIRALTGVDTDRLPEEKRRGITIELGFAPLTLEGIGTIGIVDVPGHEAFVRTMLAGATGVDLALLVVAGDEGMMPQTREHLAILELLGVSAGVVAVTKSDIADPEWIQLVEDDVRQAIASGPLAGSAIVRCSAVSGDGLDALRAAIADAAQRIPARASDDLFRMPIDRVFSVKGTGTVVTGTIWAGSIAHEAGVRILPAGLSGRVRGIESHGHGQARANSGSRTAVALGGIDRADVEPRGAVLVSDTDPWVASTVLRADVALLDGAPTLGPRTRVRFHLGTADIGARLIALGGPVSSGSRNAVRIALDEPVVARTGDRFVIRVASPSATIGGGIVTDSSPPGRRAKPWPEPGASASARLRWILAERGGRGTAVTALSIRLGVRPDAVDALLGSLGDAVRVGERVFASEALASAEARCAAAVEEMHREHPLEPGVHVQALRSSIPVAPELVDAAVRNLVKRGVAQLFDGIVARSGWKPGESGADASRVSLVLEALRTAGRQPPSVDELVATYGPDTLSVLKLLARRGDAVTVARDRYFSTEAASDLIAMVQRGLSTGTPKTTSELREITGLTRKYVIPFLEYTDRAGITVRRGDVRTLGAAGDPRPTSAS